MDQTTYPILSVCATVGNRLSDIAIKDGQLIFVQDKHKIALDYGSKRVFYNQIIEISTDKERLSLVTPTVGSYYFVIDTAILWTYQESGWVRITTPPQEVLFIGTELPEFGSVQTLYVDKVKKEISIWDEIASQYIVVADKTVEMTVEDVDGLFQ